MRNSFLKNSLLIISAVVLSLSPIFGVPVANAASITISVDGNQRFQTMDGMGVSINAHSWDNGALRPVLDSLIDQNGSTLFRVVMEMQDWEQVNDNADPNSFNWSYYDPIYSGAVTYDTAQAGSNFGDLWNTIDYLHQKGISDSQIALTFMGPGPSWNGGNTVSTAAQEDEWAEMVVSAAYYGINHGHTFGLFSPNNEEDINANEGVSMSGTVYGEAMNKVALKLDAVGLNNLRLLGPETTTPNIFWDYMAPYPALMNKVDHFTFHSYAGTTNGADADIKAAYPTKNFWMTEFAAFDDSFKLLNQGASAIMMWEAYDSVYNHAIVNGLGSQPGNDVFNGQQTLIAYNGSTKVYTPRLPFYQFAQLYKYVPIGSQRISASSTNTSVNTVAFSHASSGRFTLVGENTSSSSQTLSISLASVPNLPTNLSYYQTNSGSNMAQGADVVVSGGVATVTVPADTVFTLTGVGITDTTAPTTPSNLTASGNVGSTSLSWTASTDNVGVAQYNVYRSATPGFTPGASNKIGTTVTTTFNDTGLSAGTYYYQVIAQDAAGNVSTPSNEASATATSDTSAPVVSITNPADGGTVSGTVNVGANASDNVGVAGVQFKLDGANLGIEDTSAPYSTSWDTTTAANGTHTLSAIARDASGNISTSSVTVNVSNTVAVGGTLLLGIKTVQSTADNNPAGSAEVFRYTAAATGPAGTLSFYVDSGSAATSIKVGIYGDSAGRPGTLLASGTINAPQSAAWNTATLSSNPSLSSGTSYWIGFLGAGGQLNYRDASSGSCSESSSSSSLTALPTIWSSGPSWSSCSLSAYVSSASAPDTTAPTTSITSPSDNTTISGNAAVSANASDNVGVTKVELYADGVLKGTDTSAPYTFSLATGTLGNGTHQLTAKAYDAANNVGTSAAVTVTVSNDISAPSIPTGVVATSAGMTQTSVSWDPSIDDVGVTGYHVWRNGVQVAATPTNSFNDSGLLSNTSYNYTVSAFDAAGNESAQSAIASVTTDADTTAPVVSLSSPISGATVTGTVNVAANASDNVGVAGVQFKLDGANLGSEDSTSPYGVSWNTSLVANGDHTLTAVARDTSGNITTSTTVAVTVNNVALPVTLDTQVTTHQSSKATSISSPSLTTAQSGELLVAFITSDGPSTGGETFSTVTGGGLTWTLRKRVNTQLGTSEIWTASAPSVVSNAVVKATRSKGSYVGSITVAAFKNADIANIGAVGGSSGASGAQSASLVATKTGSVVWGVGNDWDGAVGRTVGAGQTLVDQYLAASAGDTFWVQKIDASSTAGQTMTISDSAPTNHHWNLAIIEILPAQ